MVTPMAFYSYDRRTHFSESDAAGIIHFSKYACFVEEAEHAFLGKQGFPIEVHNPARYRWPRVSFSASFDSPIFPLQDIRISLDPRCVGKSSITWRWVIFDKNTMTPLCKGEMKTVCCRLNGNKLDACPLPEELRNKLSSALT